MKGRFWKFWPKNPDHEGQGQEDRAQDGQALHDLVGPLADGGEVGVEGVPQQVAVRPRSTR
jgi:hypothetical protein